jgi:hypothetical protein
MLTLTTGLDRALSGVTANQRRIRYSVTRMATDRQ